MNTGRNVSSFIYFILQETKIEITFQKER